MVYIAETMFDVVLNPKSRWGFLEDELTSLMETVQECHCIACNGGPCNPLTHLFQPSEYLPPTAGGDDIDILLQENQIDLHPTPEASPSLQQADGQASREALQREALAQMQQPLPRIDETEEISVASPADEPEVRRSGSSGNAITKGVRSLLNQLTASSSKATSPRPTDTPLPVQSGKHGGRVLRPRLVTGVTPQPRFPTPQPRLPTPHIGLSGHSTTNRVWSGQGGAQQVPPTDSLAATMAQLTRLMEIQKLLWGDVGIVLKREVRLGTALEVGRVSGVIDVRGVLDGFNKKSGIVDGNARAAFEDETFILEERHTILLTEKIHLLDDREGHRKHCPLAAGDTATGFKV